jgi:hypothetical protein
MREPLESLEIGDGAKATGGAEFADHAMFAALIVGGWAESPRRRGFEFNSLQKSVEGEVEIEAGLLAIRDDIEPGIQLIVQGRDHGVIDHLLAVGFTELVEMSAGELKPSWERITANDRRAEWLWLHRLAGD